MASCTPSVEPASAEEVATRLHSVAIHLLRRLRREDEALGISAARLSALSVVGFGGPRTLGDLAAAEQVRPPTMTRIVAALERAGLVERQSDPVDRRVTRIAATARGRAVLQEGRARRTGKLAARLKALPSADLAALDQAGALLEALLREDAAEG
ncbi:MAG TPA: MarR family transcriptional regulator [Dehalococcoidia bacterium]|nr:MarR family transcriptional regulator [Dehalococcoidia bacterium]